MPPPFDLPLMKNNINRQDLDELIAFLQGDPQLTQGPNVKAFEEEWSRWLGVKYSVFVNSGASANLISLSILKQMGKKGQVIVPTLTWVSDIASVLQCGFEPVFIDIDPRTLCMDPRQILEKVNPETRAVFLTHAQGFNGLTDGLLETLAAKGIPLIEDVCESHGATHKGRKAGSFGWMSNFSFYFAHHMSTIEGGMVCTNDEKAYQMARMMRSHGMVRECSDAGLRESYREDNPSLNPDFIFAFPAFNMRNTEIGGVLGRSQLRRLDENNRIRIRNLKVFLENLDPSKYRTDFAFEGSCNYAFNLILQRKDDGFSARLQERMRAEKVEFRRGSAGGGNQMRQPYLKGIVPEGDWNRFPEVEHVHFYGFYIGNFPELSVDRVRGLCALLNSVE
jgi:CDP-4-dehydro-6-deoxyglucose reductase, E1